MTDLPFLRSVAAPARARLPIAAPLLLYAAVGTAAVGGLLVGRAVSGDIGGYEDKLVLLLRFMAAMKTAGVVAAALLVHWRLSRPIAPRLALGYGAALVLMAAAPGLIWSLAHVGLAAGLFHAGLLAFLVLAWRDDGALPPRWSLPPRRG